jgi:hypothetical protein
MSRMADSDGHFLFDENFTLGPVLTLKAHLNLRVFVPNLLSKNTNVCELILPLDQGLGVDDETGEFMVSVSHPDDLPQESSPSSSDNSNKENGSPAKVIPSQSSKVTASQSSKGSPKKGVSGKGPSPHDFAKEINVAKIGLSTEVDGFHVVHPSKHATGHKPVTGTIRLGLKFKCNGATRSNGTSVGSTEA